MVRDCTTLQVFIIERVADAFHVQYTDPGLASDRKDRTVALYESMQADFDSVN